MNDLPRNRERAFSLMFWTLGAAGRPGAVFTF
jgi:hypothetical protein